MKDGKSVRGGGLADLIIIDIPEGLPVPGISDEDEIPDWNSRGDNYLAAVFGYVKLVLQDQGCVIIIHPDDNGEIEDEIRDFHQVVELKSERTWTGINRLLLRSAKISGMTTCFFKVQLLTLSSNNSFDFRPTPEDYKKKSIDIVDRDVILNWVTLEQQTMRKEVPWRGAREKDVLFIESLIRATTDPGDVVVDIGAGTGASIKACRQSGRNIVALEDDQELYTEVLKKLALPPLPLPKADASHVPMKRMIEKDVVATPKPVNKFIAMMTEESDDE
ncbi:hypothetical protein KC19_N032100 [Ceratodon purpureus]|nr:hypothetical protein KC19_N032100 [Ceratodon purpureus]